MSSEEFGAEAFRYDSEKERSKGHKRLLKDIKKQNDGIERHFCFYEEVT
jgi:hypothetical protein